MASPITVHLVPHTHWDREWYLPVPDVPHAARRPARRAARRDGGRRPATPTSCSTARWRSSTTTSRSGRARGATGSRRSSGGPLAVGPWYILMDEFLVSGETIVRNLQLGLDAAARLRRGDGGRLPARHVRPRRPDAPDPAPVRVRGRRRLARRAGGDRRHAFRWRRPDGSAVRAEYLPGGYGNGATIPDDAKALLAANRELRRRARRRSSARTVLDERRGPPSRSRGYADLVAGSTRSGRPASKPTTLGDVLTPGPPRPIGPTVRTWTGELRSGHNANLLMGVASNHVDVTGRCRDGRAAPRTAWPSRWRSTAGRGPSATSSLRPGASSRTRLMTRCRPRPRPP